MMEQLSLLVEDDRCDPVEVEFHGGPLHGQVRAFNDIGWCRYWPERVTHVIPSETGITRFETDSVNYFWTDVSYPRAHMRAARNAS